MWNLKTGYNYTNASGIAVVNISSWDLCTANIIAEVGAANATVDVTFVGGPISRIILSADSGTVNSTQPDAVQEYAYRLTASLKDAGENPVEFGTVVKFKATSGTLYNYTIHNTSGLLNGTTGLGGDAVVWLSSDVPGTSRYTHTTLQQTAPNLPLLAMS